MADTTNTKPDTTEAPPDAPVDTPAGRRQARELLNAGYHVDHVARRTRIPLDVLNKWVGADGYAK
jgi:hypothetical protein